MTVLIASSFTKSLGKLTAQEQAQAKITAFDIQQNPDSPGLSLHRLDRARDQNFWSARVNSDLRIILHKKDGTTLLAYVDHHDDAYDWAERRKLESHPRTGAAQIVEIRETVQDVVIQRYIEEAVRKPPLFAAQDDDVLLSWGVPPEWLDTVRQATEDTFEDIATHLPDEAAEALLQAAVGEAPTVRIGDDSGTGFAHPDAMRRFRVVGNQEELAAALDAPWDQWAVFLHPAQQEFVDRDFNGPARVIGSAGTGKTVVALHRAVRLAKEDADHKVLLATFNAELVEGLAEKIALLTRGQTDLRARITVSTLDAVAQDIVGAAGGDIAGPAEVEAALEKALEETQTKIAATFLADEWAQIVDAWNVRDEAAYLDMPRLGRKVRMAQSRRAEVWGVMSVVREKLAAQGLTTPASLLHNAAVEMSEAPFTHVVVDEAQDISVPELKLVAAMAGARPNGLFFAGDIGQRIFRAAFPWSAVGVEVRGRSRSLKVNYRTSQQIRAKSDLLLPPRLVEADGNEDRRTGITSVFEGPPPVLKTFTSRAEEISAVSQWLGELTKSGFSHDEMAVLVRSPGEVSELQSLRDALPQAHVLSMHDAKGREYRAVAVIACDADLLPLESRLMAANDERDMQEVFDTERHLLYVAATRAREQLWVSGCDPVSEFLQDLV